MDYENMRVVDLKVLVREHGLRGYSRLRKAELIAMLQNNPPVPLTRPPRPTRPPPPPPKAIAAHAQSARFRPDRPRQPSPQEIDIFEQQEMRKNRSQVMSKLNDWYDWLVNHVLKTIKYNSSRVFKTFKNKIMGLYNRVTGI